MKIQAKLEEKIDAYRLLNHPFYEAWSCGELPVSELKTYAEEYGTLIALMPKGWQTLNDLETVEEEYEHIELWDDFAAGLETKVSDARVSEVMALTEITDELFSDSATALGALYAFEAQQPETAKSKLEGLKAFYALPVTVEPYFVEHSKNHHESEKLLARIAELSDADQTVAVLACEQMSKALWDALTGIHHAGDSN